MISALVISLQQSSITGSNIFVGLTLHGKSLTNSLTLPAIVATFPKENLYTGSNPKINIRVFICARSAVDRTSGAFSLLILFLTPSLQSQRK
jgi:hypothetical protein